MANDDDDRAQRGPQSERTERDHGADADGAQGSATAGGESGAHDERRRGLSDRGFDAGTGYGGAGNTSAYSGESSYGGQAGYGGSRMDGAYSDGKYGRDQTRMHAAGDAKDDIADGEE